MYSFNVVMIPFPSPPPRTRQHNSMSMAMRVCACLLLLSVFCFLQNQYDEGDVGYAVENEHFISPMVKPVS